MKKRDKMKMMGILILLLAVITVAITLILVSRLSKTAGKDQKEEHLTVPFPGCSAMHIS